MILNRLPRSSNINNCTPYEAYFRRKPDLSSFRVFGCLAYFWLDPSIQSFPAAVSQLDAYSGTGSLSLSRAARGMFVGYDEHRRAYRILPDGAIKYVLARVVVFDERLIIRKMLSNCSRSANINDDSSDVDEEIVHGHMHAVASSNSVPPSNNVGTPPRSALHSRTDAIASPRKNMAAVLLNDTLYFYGGESSTEVLNELWSYNLSTNTAIKLKSNTRLTNSAMFAGT